MKTGRKILNLRLDQKISQFSLARACNITAGGLSKIETGINTPSAEILMKIAKELNTAIDYLLDPKAPYPPPHYSSLEEEDKKGWTTKRISKQSEKLLSDLNKRGPYWYETALALPSVNSNTIRLIRFLIQRDQLSGANEVESQIKAYKKAGGKKRKKKKNRKTQSKKKKKSPQKTGRVKKVKKKKRRKRKSGEK